MSLFVFLHVHVWIWYALNDLFRSWPFYLKLELNCMICSFWRLVVSLNMFKSPSEMSDYTGHFHFICKACWGFHNIGIILSVTTRLTCSLTIIGFITITVSARSTCIKEDIASLVLGLAKENRFPIFLVGEANNMLKNESVSTLLIVSNWSGEQIMLIR